MIVTCQSCETSFQLDESRVPLEGIRVRCSRCKEAFFLQHPSVSQSQATHAVAEQAATTGSFSTPSATQDLEPPESRSGARAPTPAEPEEDFEEDWEFNHEPPSADDSESGIAGTSEVDRQGQGPVVDPGVSGSACEDVGFDSEIDAAFESGLSLAGEPGHRDHDAPLAASEAAPALAGKADAMEGDESAFGSVDDFSSLMEEDPDQVDYDATSEELPHQLDAPADQQEVSGRYATTGASDDLGDPESWNFLGDGPRAPAAARPPGGRALGRIGLVPAGSVDAEEPAAEWDDRLYGEREEEPGRFARAVRQLGHAVGWTLTIGLVVLGMASGLWSTAESLMHSPQVAVLGDLRAESVRGRWIQTARAGTLLVVTGEIINLSRSPQQPEGVLQVALLDREGRRLTTPPAAAGAPLPTHALREWPAEALFDAQNRAAHQLLSQPIASSERVGFMALFAEVPDEAVRFALERAPTHRASPIPDPTVGSASPEGEAAGAERAASEALEGEASAPVMAGEAARIIREAAPGAAGAPVADGYDSVPSEADTYPGHPAEESDESRW